MIDLIAQSVMLTFMGWFCYMSITLVDEKKKRQRQKEESDKKEHRVSLKKNA